MGHSSSHELWNKNDVFKGLWGLLDLYHLVLVLTCQVCACSAPDERSPGHRWGRPCSLDESLLAGSSSLWETPTAEMREGGCCVKTQAEPVCLAPSTVTKAQHLLSRLNNTLHCASSELSVVVSTRRDFLQSCHICEVAVSINQWHGDLLRWHPHHCSDETGCWNTKVTEPKVFL